MAIKEVLENKIKLGDEVIVTGYGVRTSLGGGEIAPYYDAKPMKVIMINEDDYFKDGLNDLNKGIVDK